MEILIVIMVVLLIIIVVIVISKSRKSKIRDVKVLLDGRNIDLWNDLNKCLNIRVEFGNYGEYEVFSKDKDSIIYVPQNRIDIPGFTHELLHIFLRTKDIYIGSGILLMVREKLHMQNVLSEKLIEHIGNCLEHIKMLPIFIKMGFRENDFITDYGVNKMDEQDIEILKNNFCIKSSFGDSYFNKIYVDCYIGKYFAIKACPNNSFDYSSGLCALKSINPQLYSILDSFMTEWINFNINDANPTTGGYFSMEYDFTKGLENWILSNRIR